MAASRSSAGRVAGRQGKVKCLQAIYYRSGDRRLELYDLHYCMYLPGNVYKIRRFDLFSRTLRTASLELKCAR